MTDAEMRRKLLGRGGREGIYSELASAAALAGGRKLATTEVLDAGRRVVCIHTRHGLKDGHAIGSWFGAPSHLPASLEAMRRDTAG